MKNLEQVRARNALAALSKYNEFRGKKEGDPLTGFPALIIGNGLLAAIAFSKKNKGGHESICNAIAEHLACEEIGRLDAQNPTVDTLLSHLTENESDELRVCTSEVLAYLNFLRRFAKAQAENN